MLPALLGDAGPRDDASYAGEVGDSALSLQYYRNKVTEYQQVLTALDDAYQTAQAALYLDLSPETADYLDSWIVDFQGKRGQLKATAEALNLGAAAVNALGGRMPSLSIPAGLGLGPALPFAAIAAVSVAAALIVWGQTALRGLNDRLKLEMQLDAQQTPEARAELARVSRAADDAVRVADASGLGALAPYLKWAGIALLGYVLWRAYSTRDAA